MNFFNRMHHVCYQKEKEKKNSSRMICIYIISFPIVYNMSLAIYIIVSNCLEFKFLSFVVNLLLYI